MNAKAKKYFEEGKFEKAIIEINKEIDNNTSTAALYEQRAVCYLNLKQSNKALIDINKALDLEPDNPYRYASRAFVYNSMGNEHEAIKDYEKAIELDPEDAVSYNNLGLIQEKIGLHQQAKKNFKQADELAKILDDNNIVLESNKANVSNKITENSSEGEKEFGSIMSVFKSVFTSKKTFSEFSTFVKKGFKSNNKKS